MPHVSHLLPGITIELERVATGLPAGLPCRIIVFAMPTPARHSDRSYSSGQVHHARQAFHHPLLPHFAATPLLDRIATFLTAQIPNVATECAAIWTRGSYLSGRCSSAPVCAYGWNGWQAAALAFVTVFVTIGH